MMADDGRQNRRRVVVSCRAKSMAFVCATIVCSAKANDPSLHVVFHASLDNSSRYGDWSLTLELAMSGRRSVIQKWENLCSCH
jgi:hypothetical protein